MPSSRSHRDRELDIEYYKVGDEQDIAGSCPKIKGSANWRDWETALSAALDVHSLLIEEKVENIDNVKIRARTKEILDENKRLKAAYEDNCSKWEKCNNRALMTMKKTLIVGPLSEISQIMEVREAFQQPRSMYCTSSRQQVYVIYTKFVELRYKGSGGAAAADFVRIFQEALRDLNQITGCLLPSIVELSQFKKAINTIGPEWVYSSYR
ncbi:hypothetical protein N7517_003707 [Penicillium concentricum]|uniref:Uncharacterized protein n=1 Tax=Penicillium concentricum TaxID=293559 RepID=A0A9W9S473_9EURO|nr:uncharacterized protein N7517_003707 [Penicillium concentricum]KAJ5371701.1 hypothetical protein N7517_003707 [Penicillium concentricum]